MRPPCELIVRYVLPTFRSLVVKKLVEEYKFSQVVAAKKMGITQAAVSQYLNFKRGERIMKRLEKAPAVKFIVDEVAKAIATNSLMPTEYILKFCKLCENLRLNDIVCELHKDLTPLPERCNACLT